MARKLDQSEQLPDLELHYQSAILGDLVGVMAAFSSAGFQQAIVGQHEVPADANAIPAIFALGTLGALRPSALAGHLHIPVSTCSRLIERLAAAGLVTRAADLQDARASLVSLTAAGAAATTAIFRAGDDMMSRLLGSWTSADRDRFATLIHQFANDVRTIPWQPTQ